MVRYVISEQCGNLSVKRCLWGVEALDFYKICRTCNLLSPASQTAAQQAACTRSTNVPCRISATIPMYLLH